jgi:hypothetical protein
MVENVSEENTASFFREIYLPEFLSHDVKEQSMPYWAVHSKS